MYKVILITQTGGSSKGLLRQTKGQQGISSCGKYQFYINEIIPDPDFVVIRGKTLKKKTTFNVAPENLMLTTSEPLNVLAYPNDYCRQFGIVCSCQETLKHKNVKYTPAILPWFAGLSLPAAKAKRPPVDFDTLRATPTPQKTKLISVVSSNKAFTSGHLKRIEFVERLKEYYGDKLDVFGRGYRDFQDKLEVTRPYKYQIVIENTSAKYYWTEKIADCYIGESYPIYYGCTNIGDYFPEGSYTAIDINNFDECVKTIDALLAQDTYETAKPLLRECKRMCLDEYNMFNYIARCLDTLDPSKPKKSITVKPANSLHSIHNIYNYLIKRNIFKLQRTLARLFNKKAFIK